MAPASDDAITAQALLFDMDGTLVDSTAVVERTWAGFAARHRLDLAAVLAVCHGRRAHETVALFATPGMDVAAETARLVEQEIADLDGVVAIAGAARLLAALPAGRWAVVTSAGRRLAETRLRAAGLPVPGVMVTAEDVAAGKPAPDGYLAAAAALGAAPSDCVVFEDAPAGLQAGMASGCRLVAVGRTLPPAERHGLHWIADYQAASVARAAHGGLLLSLAATTTRADGAIA